MTVRPNPDLDPDLPPPPVELFHLYGVDKRILDLLTSALGRGLPTSLVLHRVTAIGRHHRTWTGTDVLRIHNRYITGDSDPNQWHPHGWDGNTPRPDGKPAPRITLTPRRAEILDMLCRRWDADRIVTETGPP
jgi:hypothetical protein